MVKIRKRIWFFAAAVLTAALLAALARGAALRGESPARQLSLGEKFLAELDYENAALCFEKVIAVDPMNARAYLGLADAYHGMGDLEKELITLQKGFEATGDARLSARIEALTHAGDEAPPGRGAYPPALQARLEELLRCYEAGDMEAAFAIHNDPAFWELCAAQMKEDDIMLRLGDTENGSGLKLRGWYLEDHDGQAQSVSFGTWKGRKLDGPGIKASWDTWELEDTKETYTGYQYRTGNWSGGKQNGPVECSRKTYIDGILRETKVSAGVAVDDLWDGEVITTYFYSLDGEEYNSQTLAAYDQGRVVTVDAHDNRALSDSPEMILTEVSLPDGKGAVYVTNGDKRLWGPIHE